MARRTRKRGESSALPSMLLGLTLGLAVAAGVYFSGARVDVGSAPEPDARRATPAADVPAEAAAARPAPAQAEVRAGAEDDRRFEFYDILPQYEVVVPEVETVTAAARARSAPAAASSPAPGAYVLQAGSFRSMNDADRMQASLALMGVESRIQKVTIDDDVFHRVRIGPVTDLEQLSRLKAQLEGAGVNPLMMKVD